MPPCPSVLGTALITLLSIGTGSACLAIHPEKAEAQAGLDGKWVHDAVEALASQVEADYFDPAVGAKVAAGLRQALSLGRYGKVQDREALAGLLTSDMYAVAKDKHLSVAVQKEPPPRAGAGSTPTMETRDERCRRENAGFQKAEILPGNIGYLRVTAFYRPEEARETMAEAMAFLSHADALIVDLRDHGGGATPTVALFTSYFLGSLDAPLFSIAPRPPADPRCYRTEPGTLRNRDANRPTFLLTSPRTCSGGEGFAFLLQERHRAVVIGERTWGGANQVPNPHPILAGFLAYIPNGHTASSLTGTNWEGEGVLPDVPSRADQALAVAHALALKALLRTAPEGPRRSHLEKELAAAEPQSGPAPDGR